MIIGRRFRHVIRNILIQQLLNNTEDQESTASMKIEKRKTYFQGGTGQARGYHEPEQVAISDARKDYFLVDAGQDAIRISIELEEIKYVSLAEVLPEGIIEKSKY
jgi:hypothetical protein